MVTVLDERRWTSDRPGSTAQEGGHDLTYEEQLDRDPRWALSEASRYFEEKSAVQQALHKITSRLDELGSPYAVVGGMALFAHGFRRFTEVVDLLVPRDQLKIIHQKLDGLGYIRVFAGSKHLRDAQLKVKIEFLITGDYPGDGKPKPVAFPEPIGSVIEQDGIKYLALPNLIELKLASGMSNSDRIKDLADVQELIKLLDLPPSFTERLNPYVREKYTELWNAARGPSKRYVMLWRNKLLTAHAKTLDDMIEALGGTDATLEAMRADGIVLDPEGGTGHGYARLVTTDPEVAKKYEMHPEDEFFDEGEEPGGEAG